MKYYIFFALLAAFGAVLGAIVAWTRKPRLPADFLAVGLGAGVVFLPGLYCFARVSHLPFSVDALFPDAVSWLVGGYVFLLTELALGMLLGFFRVGGARAYLRLAVKSRRHKYLLGGFLGINLVFALTGVGLNDGIRAYTLRITEVCPRNFNLLGHDGDFPDYIELYNYGTRPVELLGFCLSDDEKRPAKSELPEMKVPPGGYVLVWADGSKPKVTGENQVSAGFRLKAGEQVCLSVKGKLIVETVDVPELPENVALTRVGTEDRWIEAYGTPGSPNDNAVPYVPATLEKPEFSLPGGFYPEPVTVEIKAPKGCRVYYTLDSSTPDETAALYTGPITIRDAGGAPNRFINAENATVERTAYAKYQTPVDKGTVLRAMAVDDSGGISHVAAACYFVGDYSGYRGGKVLSIVSDPEDLFGDENGICATGREYDEWAAAEAARDPATQESDGQEPQGPEPNFRGRGRAWERPAQVQLFDGDGSVILNDDCGIRLQGNTSRRYQKKRFRLTAREFYGGSDTFSSEIFPGVKSHSFHLRYDQYDFLIHELISGRDLGTLRSVPVTVFLDGELYYTAYMRECYDSTYFEEHFGVDSDDVIHISSGELDMGKAGEEQLFSDLVTYIAEHDASDPAVYAEIERQMDIESYIDFLAANFYANNLDWSYIKNFEVWRTRSDSGGGYGDGRWRWLAYDMDAIAFSGERMGVPGAQVDIFHCMEPFVRPGYPRTEYIDMPMFDSLLKNDGFKARFTETFLEVMNEDFSGERVLSLLEKYGIADNKFWTSFAQDRPEYAKKYLAQALELDERRLQGED